MKTAVCVKINKGEISPFDAAALECALEMSGRAKEALRPNGGTSEKNFAETIVLCMGPPSAKDPLERLTRLGPDRVILISDPGYAGSDTLATSYILSEAIKRVGPDLVFCGRQSIDGDTAQVGPELSALLPGFSLVTNVMRWRSPIPKKDLKKKKASGSDFQEEKILTRAGEVTFQVPAVLTFERIRELRFPSLRSKKREIEIWSNADLKLDLTRCGTLGSPTKVLEIRPAGQGRRKCQMIGWRDLVPLIEKLRHQETKNRTVPKKACRANEIWAVGEETMTVASGIAKKVVLIDPREVVDESSFVHRIQKEKPEIILWPADLWGRRTAPRLAALLQTGLCADCTELETDEKDHLLMYRPALGGDVIAKIECRTKPQMATVRMPGSGSDLIVSAGRGVLNQLAEIERWTKKIGAQSGASRGLVDTGKVPYERQVGLTGRTVSPKIYIAVGISGAVHHTCAIEGAGTIIAINSDPKARIFEYADYGIIDHFNGKELNL